MKLYQDKAWLKKKYLVEELGCPQIARIVGCTDVTILYWLKKHGIPVRSLSAAQIVRYGDQLYKDREWLRQKYVDEGLGVHQIGVLAGSNGDTVWKWLKRHDIPVRTNADVAKMRWARGDFDTEEMRQGWSVATKKNWEDEEYRAVHTGENNPAWNGGLASRICILCGKEFKRPPAVFEMHSGSGRFCSLPCKYLWYTGERSWGWKGGASFGDYSVEFNPALKRVIRERDGYTCAICGAVEDGRAHSVHHIDDDKRNSDWENLISLCAPCHGKTIQGNWMAMLSPMAIARTRGCEGEY